MDNRQKNGNKISGFVRKYLDDILYISGTVCLSTGGFRLGQSVGFFVLGACLIAYAVAVSR